MLSRFFMLLTMFLGWACLGLIALTGLGALREESVWVGLVWGSFGALVGAAGASWAMRERGKLEVSMEPGPFRWEALKPQRNGRTWIYYRPGDKNYTGIIFKLSNNDFTAECRGIEVYRCPNAEDALERCKAAVEAAV